MHSRTLALLAFSLLTAHASGAFAYEPCGVNNLTPNELNALEKKGVLDDDDVKRRLFPLGRFNGEPVRLITIGCSGMNTERNAWILIGDQRVDAFDDASNELAGGWYHISNVKRRKGGATYTVSYASIQPADYAGPNVTVFTTMSFDFATRAYEVLSTREDDPRPRLLSTIEHRIRKGDVDGAFDPVENEYVLSSWDLDPGEVMTRLLKAVDHTAKRAHSKGKKKHAATIVVRALDPMWGPKGIRVGEDGSFDYTTREQGAYAAWTVTVTNDNAPPWLYANMGFYLTEGGEHEKAVQLLTAVAHVFPDYTPAWLNLADAHAALGHDEHAKEAYATYAAQRRAANKTIPSRVSKRLVD